MKQTWTLTKETITATLNFTLTIELIKIVLNYLLLDNTLLNFENKDFKVSDNLECYDFSSSTFETITFEKISFKSSYFNNAKFNQSTFHSCDFTEAILYATILKKARFLSINFYNTICINAIFDEACFTGAKLRFSNFNHASFFKTNLSGARIYNSSFIGAKLEDAKLDYTELENFPKNYLTILKDSNSEEQLYINLLESYALSFKKNKLAFISNKNNLLSFSQETLINLSEHKKNILLPEIWQNIKSKILMNKNLINDELINYIKFFAIVSGNSKIYQEIKNFIREINLPPEKSSAKSFSCKIL